LYFGQGTLSNTEYSGVTSGLPFIIHDIKDDDQFLHL